MDMQPLDYGSVIRSGQAIVPDYAAETARQQLQQLQRAQLGLQIQQAQREQQQAQAFDEDLDGVLANPSAQNFSALILKHPQYAEKVKTSWSLMDGARQKADLSQMAQIYSAAANGRYDLAAASLRKRVEAAKAAGQPPDADDTAVLGMLESGDPEQQKKAQGMLGVVLSAITGPDKFESTLGALGPQLMPVGAGTVVIDKNNPSGPPLFESPYKPETITDPATGQVFRMVPKAGVSGGAPSAAASGGTLDPQAFFKEFVLPHEGGYNPSDANGAPVKYGINQSANPGKPVADLTEDDAAGIFQNKYWNQSGAASLPPALAAVHADTYFINPARAQQFLKASDGDPSKYMSMRETWMKSLVAKDPAKYGKYDKAWSSRNVDLRNYSMKLGGAQAMPVQVRSKQEYDRLPSGAHYYAPDGSLRVKS